MQLYNQVIKRERRFVCIVHNENIKTNTDCILTQYEILKSILITIGIVRDRAILRILSSIDLHKY